MSNGKGSKRRPMQVSREEFERNWDEAFRKQTDTNSKQERITMPDTTDQSEPRGFGRTTQMLQAAIKQSKTETVAVIMAIYSDVERAKRIVGPSANIEFYSFSEPAVVVHHNDARIIRTNMKIFVDHLC